ncbi:MAG: prepilin-type N-terminal cleavage/methylation domain-containing protein [Magnetococcales bacterium]|nr:prepilin-type N-terminal cleavage/methylation domain-containing protein [Magnetococcales bacterium]MBF0151512.1 prepilin-type N-terminal cleavage/methylation domain-containing protein [Magnetococcales bacterium]MBF0631737.1 prepilin-type N-terminal cleavage/methylation domain-containing protein [Magnetococcales bacterium]
MNKHGFTLLEALIALSMTAFILSGVYQVINRTMIHMQTLEQRAEALHLWIHLRRQLGRDLEHLITGPPDPMVLEGEEALILRCSGDIVPDWNLGPLVEVVYRWKKNRKPGGMTWERWVQPLGRGRNEAIKTLTIDQDLNRVDFALLDDGGWHPFGESAQPPWRAIRWRFEWSMIGEWVLLKSLNASWSRKQSSHP